LRPAGGPIAWLADNTQKGLNRGPGTVTLHAGPEFSRVHLEGDLEEAGRRLLAGAGEWLGAEVTAFQVHRWRYSHPRALHEAPFLRLAGPVPVLLAGDAFGQPRVEGAALAGLAAAEAIEHDLP
jgi:predicted NAD/FAD-dependent oxidoreductase